MSETKKHLTPEERAARIKRVKPQDDSEKNKSAEDPFRADANPASHVKHMIGIVSGKGGVGKSFVTASLADRMVNEGYSVGILDADITGPSIPKIYGLHGPAGATDDGAIPVQAENGVKVISINLMLDSEETPVIWRGPVIAGAVKQFWTDVCWGDVDFLFVDMPPGTGDVPLTVYQSLPLDGIIIVTSPQDLVRMIVKKAYNMAEMMKVPVLGIIENYSYLKCPDCGKKIELFGTSHIDEIAASMSLPVLGKIPLDSNYAAESDKGRIFDTDNRYIDPAVRLLTAMN